MNEELSRIDINGVIYYLLDENTKATSVTQGRYNSSNQRIELLNADNNVVSFIDATNFIKDGMVSNVSIVNGNLVITFNTDSGKSPISIPLTSIFNPSNYYQKSEIDRKLAEKQSEISNLESKIGYYECSSEASSASKTIAASNYVLGNGGSMKVKMTNANTADNATLNINSTGAKPLFYDGKRASANNSWEAGEVVEVYYDGTNYYANNVAGGGKFATGEKVKEVGIDDEPTAGSNNPVKSDGVYKSIFSYIEINIDAANAFKEYRCYLPQGSKIAVEQLNDLVINNNTLFLRPTYGSSTGQVSTQIISNDIEYPPYFTTTFDVESVYIYSTHIGTLKLSLIKVAEYIKDGIVKNSKIANNAVNLDKLKIDLSPLLNYDEAAETSTIFYGPYPNYSQKKLSGQYWTTNIFDVSKVSKVKIAYNSGSNVYGIAFSKFGDTVENFNSGTYNEWWYQYQGSKGEVLINVPAEANFLALGLDTQSTCYFGLVEGTQQSGNAKNCLYIGDSISTNDNYKWKGILEDKYGINYVRAISGEITPADGGIPLMPNNRAASIWYKCAEGRMAIYDFDIISLMGGTNDMVNAALKVGDVDANGDYLNVADIVPFVDDASSFSNPSNYNDVMSANLTYAESLKGCIEMLHRNFPLKPIVIPTVMPCAGNCGNYIYENEGSPINGVRMSERVAIITLRIAEYYRNKGLRVYGVPFYWNIRTVESISAFSNVLPNGSVDGVHPNYLCAQAMAKIFSDYWKMNN